MQDFIKNMGAERLAKEPKNPRNDKNSPVKKNLFTADDV
jgi:hypothetical protein